MSFPPPTEKQARILWVSMTGLALGVLLGLFGLLAWGMGWLIRLLSPILWPLAIAGIIAYLLDPMVDFFERRKVPRPRAIILVFIIVLAAVAAVLVQVVPRLVFETKRLIDEVPNYTKQAQHDLSKWFSRQPLLLEWKEKFWPADAEPAQTQTNQNLTLSETNAPAAEPKPTVTPSSPILPDRETATKIVEGVLAWLAAKMPVVGNWLLQRLSQVASWAGMIVGLALVPVFAFYLLLEKRRIQKTWTDYLPVHESRFKEEIVFVLTAINNYMIAFFRGQVVVAMCIGILLTFGFLLLGLNYAVLLGVLAGVLSIVPYLGAILTLVPSVALAAVQFKDWLHPALVLAVFVGVQSLEGLVISPKIMGDRVGLHPMTIILAVLVGTTLLGGILGGVLAIPLTAALRVIMFRYVWKRPQKS